MKTTKTWYIGLRRGRKRVENYLLSRGDTTRKQAREFVNAIAKHDPLSINPHAAMLLHRRLRG